MSFERESRNIPILSASGKTVDYREADVG